MTAADKGRRPPARSPVPGSAHADTELLLSYLRADLSEGEADRLREHLTGCPECTELLLDLAAFERGAPPVEDGAEREASWRRLAAVRPWEPPAGGGDAEPAEGPAGEPPEPPPQPPQPPPRRRRWLPWLRSLFGPRAHPATAVLLATSLVAAAGLGLRTLQLERRLTEPRPDLPLVELYRTSPTRGAEGERDVWRVPRGASFTVVITPDVTEAFPYFEAQIADEDDEVVWSGRLTPGGEVGGYVTLGLSRRLLSGRRYTISLQGVAGERRVPAGTFRLEFAPERPEE